MAMCTNATRVSHRIPAFREFLSEKRIAFLKHFSFLKMWRSFPNSENIVPGRKIHFRHKATDAIMKKNHIFQRLWQNQFIFYIIWDEVFKSGLSKFLKAAFHKRLSIHSWILCPSVTINAIWIFMISKYLEENSRSKISKMCMSYWFILGSLSALKQQPH